MHFAGEIMAKMGTTVDQNSANHLAEANASGDHLPPLVRALKASAERKTVAFHFPGHKRGQAAPSPLAELIGTKPFLHDVTELPDLDRFFSPKGPLLEAKRLAAELFGAKETWFLVGALVAVFRQPSLPLVRRGILLSCRGTLMFRPLQVKSAIRESKASGRKVGAVFVTSPTYNGICSNLSDISKVCHSQGIPLIVDEAHGAHFKFHPQMPKTALDQGADISIQSTHKVLCSFSQTSMLHISGEKIDRERLHKCLHALQSTSPSWLFLAIPRLLKHGPFACHGCVWQLGLSGFQANEILDNDLGIIPELVSTNSVTLAFSQGTTGEHVQRLVSGLKHLSGKFSAVNCGNAVTGTARPYDDPVMSLNPREAFFASKTRMRFKDCSEKVCGEFLCPYPPGIPVLVPGEVITQKALDYLHQIKSHGGYIVGAADPQLDSIFVCKKSH
ncbi:UNVERIFIED_CONTAM: Arginine decarboxylase [Sesamum latifolium]|uniref:Arginine decarboxylase n=1 Tax=Sesamum latifolium TaxID=2727402 RepID=A0AAW2VBY8_9LAMI